MTVPSKIDPFWSWVIPVGRSQAANHGSMRLFSVKNADELGGRKFGGTSLRL